MRQNPGVATGWVPRAVAVALGVVLVAGGVVARTAGGRPEPAPGTGLPVAGVGSELVELSPDARVHPAGGAVLAQLQVHYDAINNGDYAAWRTTVVPARGEGLPEPAWREAYATTRDGSMRVHRIDDLPDGTLLVRVGFISTQDLEHAPAAAPAERVCWLVSLPMTGSPPRIGETRSGSSRPRACP